MKEGKKASEKVHSFPEPSSANEEVQTESSSYREAVIESFHHYALQMRSRAWILHNSYNRSLSLQRNWNNLLHFNQYLQSGSIIQVCA